MDILSWFKRPCLTMIANELKGARCYICLEPCTTRSPCTCQAFVHGACFSQVRWYLWCTICDRPYSDSEVKDMLSLSDIKFIANSVPSKQVPDSDLLIIAAAYGIEPWFHMVDYKTITSCDIALTFIQYRKSFHDLRVMLERAAPLVYADLPSLFLSSNESKLALIINAKKRQLPLDEIKLFMLPQELNCYLILSEHPEQSLLSDMNLNDMLRWAILNLNEQLVSIMHHLKKKHYTFEINVRKQLLDVNHLHRLLF